MKIGLGAALAALFLGGCATTPFTKISSPTGWSPEGKTPLTAPIALLADTQFHESRGVASRYAGRAGEEFVEVTVRTGQQVIGAGDVFKHALTRAREFPLVLHAGDALDVSCQTEWSLFKQVATAERGQPGPTTWLFAPGNHDGFLTGNIYPQNTGLYVEDYWSNMCNSGQRKTKTEKGELVNRVRHMPKNEVLNAYVAMLQPLAASVKGARACSADGALCWSRREARDAPWTEYLVQRVRLPVAAGSTTPIYALLLDSSDFAQRPYLHWKTLAGAWGGLSAHQLQAARALLEDLPANARYFFVAHHPASVWRAANWPSETKDAWSQLLQDPRSLRFLVSAHTHEGSFRRYQEHIGPLTELNIGSLADAPAYIRSLAFERDGNGNIGFRSKAMPLTRSELTCEKMPEPATGYHYGVETQRSESNRASGSPLPLRVLSGLFGAIGHFIQFWEAKHLELRPQLLAYADVVQTTMPADAEIRYRAVTVATGDGPEVVLRGRDAVAQALRQHANCRNGKGLCSVQAKANLLNEVESYYWTRNDVPQAVKDRAHMARLCMALDATAMSPGFKEREDIEKLVQDMRGEWAIQLTPQRGSD